MSMPELKNGCPKEAEMTRLVLASRNRDKLKEIETLVSELNLEFILSSELLPDFEVIEDQETLLANAVKKAIETAKATGLPALADDTGLFISALDGAPGVYAARFAGKGCSYADNRKKVLSLLQAKNEREAEFRTVVVLAVPDGVIAYSEGKMQGKITTFERGSNGFGYDSIFEVSGTGKTYAEMNEEEKNLCSHRAKAFSNILPVLKEYFNDDEK